MNFYSGDPEAKSSPKHTIDYDKWPHILEPNFLIITCRDCYKHKWCTRHN